MFASLSDAITRGRGVERAFCCPIHGDTHASASVNVRKGVWYCHACHAKGTMDSYYESDETKFANEINEIMGQEDRAFYPESWLMLFSQDNGYWASRFTPEAIKHFQLGYDGHKGQSCYPMRDQAGRILGMVYRSPLDNVGPKYRYPTGVHKSELLFGYSPDQRNQVVLVEGAMDVVAAWEAGHVAWGLYGSKLHMAQVRLLHRAGVERVVLCLDNDRAGREASVPAEWVLAKEGFTVVRPKWTEDAKDLGELSIRSRKSMLDPLAL